jgi:hypothetical protein
MELAARRAREAPTAHGPGARDLGTPPGQERTSALGDTGGVDEEPKRRAIATMPPERWLALAVAVAALLVIIAAIALAVSLSSGSAPVATQNGTHGSTHAGGTATPPGTHTSQPSAAPATPQTTTTLPLATPGGAPVISSLNPSSGGSGQTIQVTGSNFLSSDGQIVATFGGQVAATICPSQTTCAVTVPSGSPTSGSAPVVITTSAGPSNTVTFTYS